MKNRTLAVTVLLGALNAMQSFAEVSFGLLRLNSNDEVLYTVTNENSGNYSYTSLFEGFLENGEASGIHPVSCFPERIEIAGPDKNLYIKNRYGNAVYDFKTRKLSWTALKSEIPEYASLPLPEATSITGRWSCVMENTVPFHGRLSLTDKINSRKIILDENTDFDWHSVPVKWSPDGTKLLYQKNGSIYFSIPEALFKGVQLDEEFYKIGNGTINSVFWNSNDNITFIDSDLVFRINATEFTSLALYSQYIQIGKIVARLPEKFNSSSDVFWSDETGNEIIVAKANNVVSYYRTKGDEPSGYAEIVNTQSFVEGTKRPLGFELFWKGNKSPVLYVDFASDVSDFRTTRAYTVSSDGKFVKTFSRDGKTSQRCISPDGKYMAFSSDNSIFVYSTQNWTKLLEDSGEKLVNLLWRDNENLLACGSNSVRLISVKDASAEYLFPSSIDNAYWSEDEQKIYFSDLSGRDAVYERSSKVFKLMSHQDFVTSKKLSVSVQNSRYRIFTGNSKNSSFRNAVYVRSLKAPETTSLMLKQTGIVKKGKKQASLVIDLLDNADGLGSILSLCRDFNIRCTFFINGEFIRRYPEETKSLSASGHECASMFFTPVDLTKKEMNYNEQFVIRGLARNEDEFYNCTGSELSLWWHAPYNKADSKIKLMGEKAGYSYFDVSKKEVEVSENRISVTLTPGKDGAVELAKRFELFVNEMLNGGYEIVTVSQLAD